MVTRLPEVGYQQVHAIDPVGCNTATPKLRHAGPSISGTSRSGSPGPIRTGECFPYNVSMPTHDDEIRELVKRSQENISTAMELLREAEKLTAKLSDLQEKRATLLPSTTRSA
jgi:hypothetical protein